MKTIKIAAGCYEVTVKGDTYRIQSYDWFNGNNGWQILLEVDKTSFIDESSYVEWVWCNTFATKADCLRALEGAM